MWQLMRDTGITTRPLFLLCVLLLFQLLHRPCFSIGGDTLSMNQTLSEGQTLVSQGSNFELGFFTKGTPLSFYLGIWYKHFAEKIMVWAANRENMFSNTFPLILEFSEDGNLILHSRFDKDPIWSTNFVSPKSNSTEAVLQDNGNFVVRDVTNPSIIYWQSFDHPTDTLLPGAKLGIDKRTSKTQVLTSWKNSEDPAPGKFSFEIDRVEKNQYFLEWNNSKRIWGTGVRNIGHSFSSSSVVADGGEYSFKFISNENESYLTYSVSNSSIFFRLVMDMSGELRLLQWFAGNWDWWVVWSQGYASCGAFGILRERFWGSFCECLPGYEPFSIEETTLLNDWSGGCVSKTPLQCENGTNINAMTDGFSKFPNTTLPENLKVLPGRGPEWCKSACMQNCSCTAYTYNSSGCLVWEGDLLFLQKLRFGINTKQDLYLKLAASDQLPNVRGDKKNLRVIIAVPVSLTLIISVGFIYCLIRRKLKQIGEEDSSEDLLLFDFSASASANAAAETNTGNNLGRSGKKDVELPLFSFASVSAATGNFSAANKLGEGGFGPVYKGNLLKGQEIAVKRLSRTSGQGLQEFKNETLLIAKLQHRNLVKLLGCCIERDENILIYEYMPNKSLDFFLFGPNKQGMLDWRTSIRIIDGIAQGLLYLHQYSRLRIIHRDLKASNILLDSEMNPKISDFGMARIFGGNESQANTNRIVGTYGYMSPEYAMEGLFSIKSDVFSFGVLLLEIMSGKKNTGFYHSDSLFLLGYAWELWSANRGVELMDPLLGNPPSATTLLRYISIGLLCVKGNANDRPTMSDVVSMLTNEYAPLPIPKEPAFFTGRGVMNTNPPLSNAENCSVNTVTLSIIEARRNDNLISYSKTFLFQIEILICLIVL
ncbi:receptor-like serine/threonine-protein kinase SD1-8 isoform X2 [Cornus florida]|uniref:receptor-like serine/threonine-protein kinase SD1-8 isoform X2 n=1 Tax=Cornus florida TaxID=4283 RepID=UPI00289EB511|nr:receptor-like serine/threonine-protein kinase SD1-8 isoform X2 [Cornus florida]